MDQIVNKQLKNVNKFLKIEKKLPPLKRILALPTWGQICTVSVLQPFLSDFFQMEHPVKNVFGISTTYFKRRNLHTILWENL